MVGENTMSAKAYSYIRWSSKAQTEGDSLRRQLKSSRLWASKRGITLDETLRDEGVSSYRGDNRKKGDLGKFIAQVQSGQVASGSYLLIDEFSRLGREPEVQMMNTLTTLILSGITIVTMNDEREYGPESANEERLMGALMAISVSHRTAKRQGAMVKEAHGESKRRARDDGRIWHAAGPSWFKAEVTGKGVDRVIKFHQIPERVAIVQRIFDMVEAGMGTSAIGVRFNTEEPKVPPFKHAAKGWQHAAVLGIAKSRTVLGEYQPQVATQGAGRAGRSPDGLPIPGYYDAIIDEDQFNRVQAIIASRRRGTNRKGNAHAVTNLFQGICKCGVCGGTVGIHTSVSKRDKSVLRCVDSGRGLCTNKTRHKYPEFEDAILLNVTNFDLTAPATRKADSNKLALDAALGRRIELKRMIISLTDQSEDPETASKSIRVRLVQRENELETLEATITELAGLVSSKNPAMAPKDHQQALEALLTDLGALEGADLYDRRLAISNALKGIIAQVRFYPSGGVMCLAESGHNINDHGNTFPLPPAKLEEIGDDPWFKNLFAENDLPPLGA